MVDLKSILMFVSALAAVAAFQFLYKLYQNRRRFRSLSGPPHSFLWGHLKVMGEAAASLPPNNHPQAYITLIAQKYDLQGVFYLDLWPVADPQVVLIEPELMDQVQVHRAYDQHPMAEELLASIVGPNVVATANGPVWKKLHNAMAPSFLISHVRTLTGLMADETMLFQERLRELATSGVFSLEKEISKLIFDIVGQTVFNFPLHAQTQGSSYLDDLKEIQELVNQSLTMNPLLKLKVWMKKDAVRRRVDASISEKIVERFARMRDENVVPTKKDFMSILDLMLRETLLKDGQGGMKTTAIPKDELDLLVTNVKGLLLGGQGTTVDTLCFVYMLLSKNPEVVQKIRSEHNEAFGRNTAEALEILENNPTKLNDLEYTSAAIKETLRLFPVGFGIRTAPTGSTVNYQNRTYPIDDLVVVPCWHTMHYDEAYFPEPNAFRPERLLNDGVPRSWFRSFSRGARACLGQNLAMDMMRVVLLLTVRDFDFDCAEIVPNPKPRSTYTDLDTVYGDIIFQELALEAKPRGGMMMTVKTSGHGKA
ncbi:putative Cytochrome P450 [Seiridium cardinale]|uniref:Cytochrome P450 n=1 Tax=Seiridium cardinale TaxID=138064 RepID=A0ABR2Y674_9PEZI